MRLDETPISCMLLRMELSLDGSLEVSVNERFEEEQNNQTLKENNKDFYYAHGKEDLEQPKKLELSKTQQKKQAQKLHWVLMRLQNQQNEIAKVQIMQVNEIGNKTNEEDNLQEREKLMGKNKFLSWFKADSCIKDKLMGHYAN